MILHLFVPGVPKNSNARSQWARHAANRDRQAFKKRAFDLVEPLVLDGIWAPPAFTMIVARHISPVRRRRDPTGLAERLKGILDGLVDAKALIDDDEDHIAITLAHSRKGPEAGISLTLFEVPQP